ncbi:phage NinH family protein [Corynebacterium simulans]|uniref:hypothetical protein n=1 Tax=Corynebacterium TaxID=1716 RepID=UPI000782AE9B|nr:MULTISPECIES: hypothetical protein [Corynebacterium]AMO91623.1 phage NinH family protein [Corynebacterium simulans]OFR40942.1 hypothetical protein HMPREF2888_04075 [Corynebacterium sp. HMSC077D03]
MTSIHTVRVRKEWLEVAVQAEGNKVELAKKLDCNPSTISRQLNDKAEAGPILIGAILDKVLVLFEETFIVSEDELRPRRTRESTAA